MIKFKNAKSGWANLLNKLLETGIQRGIRTFTHVYVCTCGCTYMRIMCIHTFKATKEWGHDSVCYTEYPGGSVILFSVYNTLLSYIHMCACAYVNWVSTDTPATTHRIYCADAIMECETNKVSAKSPIERLVSEPVNALSTRSRANSHSYCCFHFFFSDIFCLNSSYAQAKKQNVAGEPN